MEVLEEKDFLPIIYENYHRNFYVAFEKEYGKFVKEKIIEKTGITNIVLEYIGPVIGSHAGQGTVALFFIGKDKIEPNDDLLKNN